MTLCAIRSRHDCHAASGRRPYVTCDGGVGWCRQGLGSGSQEILCAFVLKTVFIGSRNTFNLMLVDWLAQRTELVGAIWIDASRWQRTWRGRRDFVRRRIRRYGVRKTLDEIAFFIYYHRFHAAREIRDLEQRVIQPFRERLQLTAWEGDTVSLSDPNSPEALAFIRERQPDLGFAMCIRNYFGPELRSLMKHGVFLWHDGYTPEYRGLYSPFWAVHNLDFDRVGYTLLQMNDVYDGGEIFVQGPVEGADVRSEFHEYLGHKAIADGLPAVERFLTELEQGTATPLARGDATSAYYTYPGLSDFLRQRMRLRRLPSTTLAPSTER
jgi:hypothetical protein